MRCKDCWNGNGCVLPARHRGAHVSATGRQVWMGRRKPLADAAQVAAWRALVDETMAKRAEAAR